MDRPEVLTLTRSGRGPVVWRSALVLFVLGCCSLWGPDFSISRYFAAHPLGGEPARLFDAAEHFGTPFGQLLILLTILAATRRRCPGLLRIFLGATAAGMSANIGKLLVARTRPRSFDFAQHGLWDGFTDWLPFGAGGSIAQSFPSAHTASAFGFAALMSWAYPQARVAFLTIAVLTGCQRVCSAAHFPSDVCFGAALGWAVGCVFVSWRPLEQYFSGVERNWSAGAPWWAVFRAQATSIHSESADRRVA